jgi:capsular exopolysaccharide synthesis family protein
VLVQPVLDRPFNPGTGGIDKVLNMGTEKSLATSTAVAQMVKDQLKLPDDATVIAGRANAQTVGTTQLLVISYTDSTRLGAQRGAQAFADAYLRFKAQAAAKSRDTIRANITKPLQAINDQMTAVRTDLAKAAVTPNNPQLAVDQQTLADLQHQAQQYNDSLAALDVVDVADTGSVVSPASVPTKPLSPRPKLYSAAGLVAGLILGVGIAFFRDRLNGRLRDRLDLEDHLGAPVLARIPRTRRRGKPTLATVSRPDSTVATAYRILRAQMLAAAQRRGVKTVMVASSAAEDGRSAVAANLAASLAQVGKRVVLVSADLRHSRAHEYFGLERDRGLANVLAGEIHPLDAVQQPAGIDRLRVYTPGRSHLDGDDLLHSDAMRHFVDSSRLDADFVVIDAPAALDTSGALSLATLVDGVVLVADAHRTLRDDVSRVHEAFDRIGAQVLGGVMSNVKDLSSDD